MYNFSIFCFNHPTLDPTEVPLGFHFVHLYFFFRVHQCPPDLGFFLVDFFFLNRILSELLRVLSPSVGVIYTLGHMSTNFKSSESVMDLDHSLVRVDSPESA